MASQPKVKIPGVLGTVGNVVRIDPEFIKVSPRYNVRGPFNSGLNADGSPIDREDAQIKESIRGNNWMETQPAVVRVLSSGDIVLVQGHRRYAAYMELRSEGVEFAGGIPCILEDGKRTDADRDLDLLVSNSGKALTPEQRGIICQRLRMWGWKDEKIAERAGITTRYVADLCLLADADPALLEMVKGGKMSASFATKLIRAHGEQAKKIAAEAEKRRLANIARKEKAGETVGARDNVISEVNVGPSEEKVTGQPAKVGTAPRPPGTPANVRAHTRNARDNGDGGRDSGAKRDTGKKADIAGPVRHGTGTGDDDDVADIFDARNVKIAWCETPEISRMLVEYTNMGWHLYKGKGAEDAGRKAPAKRKAASRKAPASEHANA